MRPYKNYILVLLAIWSGVITCIAQEACDLDQAKALVMKVKETYENIPRYSMDVRYTMYEDATSNRVLEEYIGVIRKRNLDFYSKIHHTESLQLAENYIRVNHDEKAIVYAYQKDEDEKVVGMQLQHLFTNFEKAIVEEGPLLYTITFLSAPISQSPYGVVILEVTKSDYTLKKQTLFFSGQIPVKTASGIEKDTNPRLEIVFNNFSTKENIDDSRFKLSSYIRKKSNGYTTSEALKNYQFIDTTIQ